MIINPASIESSPTPLSASSRYQSNFDLSSSQLSRMDPDVALDDGSEPAYIDFLID